MLVPETKLKIREVCRSGSGSAYAEITRGSLDEIAAIAAGFDITEDQADYLFLPDSYPAGKTTKRYVITRIERFVKRDGQLPDDETSWGQKL